MAAPPVYDQVPGSSKDFGSMDIDSFQLQANLSAETKPGEVDRKNLKPGYKLEVQDFTGSWYPAKISEIDWIENEMLVHFENWNSKFDEWVEIDSCRVRCIQSPPPKVKFEKGETVMALWSPYQKFPGTVQTVLSNDRYDILFYDGFLKRLKSSKIYKMTDKDQPSSHYKSFDDIGSKEDRRARKRKINVAELFNKKPIKKASPTIKTYPANKPKVPFPKKTPEVEPPQTPVDDVKPQLPITPGDDEDNSMGAFEMKTLDGGSEVWYKKLSKRPKSNKNEIIIVNPQGRKFRCRNEIMKHCTDSKLIYNSDLIDFSVKGRPKNRPIIQTEMVPSTPEIPSDDKNIKKTNPVPLKTPLPQTPQTVTWPPIEEAQKIFVGGVEVPVEDGQLICPVQSCRKHFRKENLLHMHMKHYHKEFSKFVNSTPSVTDLAYARTVGPETTPTPPKKVEIEKPIKRERISNITPQAETKRTPNKPVETIQPPMKVPKVKQEVPEPSLQPENFQIFKNLSSPPGSSSAADKFNENIEVKNEVKDETEENKKRKKCDSYQMAFIDHLHKRKTLPVADKSSPKRPVGRPRLQPFTSDDLSNSTTSSLSQFKGNVITEKLYVSTELSDVTEGTEDSKSPSLAEQEKIEKLRINEIVNCSCGIQVEDGLMIQCDLCLCWQHGHCLNIIDTSEAPEKYTCHICKHSYKGRKSMKYFNDQYWLKDGVLPSLSFRTKNHQAIRQRNAILKRTNDLSGSLVKLESYIHSLKVKYSIAQKKDHPKLWLWAKKWHDEKNKEKQAQLELTPEHLQQRNSKGPEPEAPIDLVDCRINLLEHIKHSYNQVKPKLSSIESQIAELEAMQEDAVHDEPWDNCPRTKATLQMLIRDLETMNELGVAMS